MTDWNPNVNNVVLTLALSSSTLYVGGWFTEVGGQPRNSLAAIDINTGAVTDWNPNPNEYVSSLALSSSTLYVGGWFTSIGGQPRNYLAAIDINTGAVTDWNPEIDYGVSSLALSSSTLYVGGWFTSIGGQPRNYLAAIDINTGVVTDWNPEIDYGVSSLALSSSTLYVGGYFDFIGGQERPYFAQFDFPRVKITESGGSTNVTEGGTTDSYTIVLATQPTANVTIIITPDSQVSVSTTTIVFTTSNWNTPQTITVSAIDDSIVEGNHTGTITHSAFSADPDYNGISIANVNVNITDNDTTTSTSFSTQSQTSSRFFSGGIKPTPPFKILINFGQEETNTTTVTLFLNGGPDAVEMVVSNFPDFRDAYKEKYNILKIWNLCQGKEKCEEGEHTVYVKFYNNYGRSSEPVFDSIIYKKTVSFLPQIISIPTLTPQKSTPTSTIKNYPLPSNFKFTRNLKYGDKGIEIRYLQIFLKSQGKDIYPEGIVSGFFGPLTQKAVIKFQEKYAEEILKPWGFKKGTGIVGPTTRAKINQMLGR